MVNERMNVALFESAVSLVRVRADRSSIVDAALDFSLQRLAGSIPDDGRLHLAEYSLLRSAAFSGFVLRSVSVLKDTENDRLANRAAPAAAPPMPRRRATGPGERHRR
jgi:hypothetical protein